MKSQGIIKVIHIHPVGAAHVCTNFHCNLCKSCWDGLILPFLKLCYLHVQTPTELPEKSIVTKLKPALCSDDVLEIRGFHRTVLIWYISTISSSWSCTGLYVQPVSRTRADSVSALMCLLRSLHAAVSCLTQQPSAIYSWQPVFYAAYFLNLFRISDFLIIDETIKFRKTWCSVSCRVTVCFIRCLAVDWCRWMQHDAPTASTLNVSSTHNLHVCVWVSRTKLRSNMCAL